MLVCTRGQGAVLVEAECFDSQRSIDMFAR